MWVKLQGLYFVGWVESYLAVELGSLGISLEFGSAWENFWSFQTWCISIAKDLAGIWGPGKRMTSDLKAAGQQGHRIDYIISRLNAVDFEIKVVEIGIV